MTTWKDILQFEKFACSRAWDRLWAYLPFTAKQASTTFAVAILTAVVILFAQGPDLLIESWGGLAGLIGAVALLCVGLIAFLYEYEMVSVSLYKERDDLQTRISEIQTPRLRVEFREGDIRYLRKERAGTWQFENIVQISIHNDTAATIDEVTVYIDDAMSSKPLPEIGWLLFGGELFTPRTLMPGDHFYVRLIVALDGTSFRVTYRPVHNVRSNTLRGTEFLLKVRVGARNVAPTRLLLCLEANPDGCIVTQRE